MLTSLCTHADPATAVPDHSVLQPPKQAPSVWQIFFTDWLGNKRASDGEDTKLNVVKEAKAAAKAYGQLSDEERSVCPLFSRTCMSVAFHFQGT